MIIQWPLEIRAGKSLGCAKCITDLRSFLNSLWNNSETTFWISVRILTSIELTLSIVEAVHIWQAKEDGISGSFVTREDEVWILTSLLLSDI